MSGFMILGYGITKIKIPHVNPNYVQVIWAFQITETSTGSLKVCSGSALPGCVRVQIITETGIKAFPMLNVQECYCGRQIPRYGTDHDNMFRDEKAEGPVTDNSFICSFGTIFYIVQTSETPCRVLPCSQVLLIYQKHYITICILMKVPVIKIWWLYWPIWCLVNALWQRPSSDEYNTTIR